MISRSQWEDLRSEYYESRSITRAAEVAGVSRKCAAFYLFRGNQKYPAINSVIAAVERTSNEAFAAAHTNIASEIIAGAKQLRLKVRGKRNLDGTTTVDSIELKRLQSILSESVKLRSDIEAYHEYTAAEGGTRIDRDRLRHGPPTNERAEQDRLRQQDLDYWSGLEKRFLTAEQLKLNSLERADVLANTILLKVAAASKQRIAATMTNPTKNVSAVSVR